MPSTEPQTVTHQTNQDWKSVDKLSYRNFESESWNCHLFRRLRERQIHWMSRRWDCTEVDKWRKLLEARAASSGNYFTSWHLCLIYFRRNTGYRTCAANISNTTLFNNAASSISMSILVYATVTLCTGLKYVRTHEHQWIGNLNFYWMYQIILYGKVVKSNI